MATKTLAAACLLVVLVMIINAGCRKDAAAGQDARSAPPPPAPAGTLLPHAVRAEVTVRLRKLGGADGEQLVNQIRVTTPLDDDFTVTEQVGATQLELRGRVTALDAQKFRVRFNYSEISPEGHKRMQSTVELASGAEENIGGMVAEQGMETLLLT